jgi:hypothetical protein
MYYFKGLKDRYAKCMKPFGLMNCSALEQGVFNFCMKTNHKHTNILSFNKHIHGAVMKLDVTTGNI